MDIFCIIRGVWGPRGLKVVWLVVVGIKFQPQIPTGSVFTDTPNSVQPWIGTGATLHQGKLNLKSIDGRAPPGVEPVA